VSRKSESITLSVSEEDKTELENIALEFGCTWGEKPNISKLMKQIASRELLLSKSDKPAKQKRALIKDAIASIQEALTILLELI
jgi:hypothetical protein